MAVLAFFPRDYPKEFVSIFGGERKIVSWLNKIAEKKITQSQNFFYLPPKLPYSRPLLTAKASDSGKYGAEIDFVAQWTVPASDMSIMSISKSRTNSYSNSDVGFKIKIFFCFVVESLYFCMERNSPPYIFTIENASAFLLLLFFFKTK